MLFSNNIYILFYDIDMNNILQNTKMQSETKVVIYVIYNLVRFYTTYKLIYSKQAVYGGTETTRLSTQSSYFAN